MKPLTVAESALLANYRTRPIVVLILPGGFETDNQETMPNASRFSMMANFDMNNKSNSEQIVSAMEVILSDMKSK